MMRVLVLGGPTGVGKSRIAVEVAERLEGEIVSADSRQVYDLLRIGTARVGEEEMRRVPHHMTGFLDPKETYSAGRFAREGRRVIEAIVGRGRLPVVCGGTGFYIKALLEGLFDGPSAAADPADIERVRRSLGAQMERIGPRALHRRLETLDPASAARIHPNDSQRILRALEVYEASGRTLSQLHREARSEGPAIEACKVCLSLPRPVLYEEIDRRVERMFEEGLVAEVEGLLERGYDAATPALESLGYSQVILYLRGECSLEGAKEGMKRETRRYAKRQMTWFRREKGYRWTLAGREAVGWILAGWEAYDRRPEAPG